MKKEYIDELLNRFLLGETTEQEEQTLAEFFRSAEGIPAGWLEMPTEWAEFAAMFRAFEIGEPSFSAEEMEGFATPGDGSAGHGKLRIAIQRWAAAAVVLVLLGFAWQWKAEENERAGSTAPSVTPYEAKRSVGIADAGETSVRPGVRLHQTEAGRQARTEIESYAKAHEDSPAGGNPHDESWGYRQSRGSATLPSRTAATLPSQAETAVYPSQAEATVYPSRTASAVYASDNPESRQAAAYRSPAVYVMCLSDGEEDVMGECERAILEEEFQSQEERLKTVSL